MKSPPIRTAATGKTEEAQRIRHQIAYHIGAKAKPNDQVTLQFDIGNDWYATEDVKESRAIIYET